MGQRRSEQGGEYVRRRQEQAEQKREEPMGGDGEEWSEGGGDEEESGNEELTYSAPHPCPYIHPYDLILAESQPRTAGVTHYVWTGEHPGYNT
jgi:hypothetical protein